MKPQKTISRVTTPDGKELVLYQRDGVYSIRVDGLELMSSWAHGSEEELARLVLAQVKKTNPNVLVGGLGMGYTLRSVLDYRPKVSRVTVAELFSSVIDWNRKDLSDLAGAPLNDPRVTVFEGDVVDLLADSPNSFDAVLLDIDNGPAAFTLQRNEELYRSRGLATVRRSIRPGGILGVWSADPDSRFEKELHKAGFNTQTETVPARNLSKGPKHTIFIAKIR